MKETIKTFLPFVLGVVIIILLFKDCGNVPIIKDDTTTELISKKDNQIEKLISKSKRDSIASDSSKKTLVIVKHHYHTVFDTIYKYAPIECDSSLNVINVACTKLDSANTVVINKQQTELIDKENTIQSYKERVLLTNTQHDNDSTNIVNLHLEVKKQKGTKIAVIVGAICAIVGTVFLLH